MFNPDITEVYFKGTPEAINKIIEWWKASDLELGKDIQIVDIGGIKWQENKVGKLLLRQQRNKLKRL